MKKMKTITSILMLLFLSSFSFGQNVKPLAIEVQKKHRQKTTFTNIDQLLTPQENSALSQLVGKEVKNAEIFNYDETLATEIILNKYQALTFDIELNNQLKTIEVVLVKESFNDYVLTTSSGKTSHLGANPAAHYRGIVLGEENTSLVALSIFQGEIVGVISTNDLGDFNIGKLSDHDFHVIYNDANLLVNPTFECFSTDDELEKSTGNAGSMAKSNNSEDYCINVYFEVDHEIYQNEGSSVANTETFVTGLFNQTAAIYQNEFITVQISEIFVWDTPDSYSNTNIATARNQFVAANPTFNGDLAQLLEYSTSGGGGIAYGIGGLCGGTSSPGPYAATTLFPDFAVVPLYSRQVKVLTHEMGHNLGSRHTHACVWNGNNTTYDDYGNYFSNGTFQTNSEGASCVDQANPKLNITPTIMSYYDSRNFGTFPMSNGFGDQPGDKIRSEVLAATCFSLCNPVTNCANTVTTFPYTETFESALTTVNGLGSWIQSSADDFNWTRNSGSTTSSSTGPSAAAEGMYYAYTESSSPNNPSKTAILESPCFDLTGQNGMFLSFAYHMYGSSMGTLDLQLTDDGGTTWTSVWDETGDKGDEWFYASVDLSAYAGSTIQLRYFGTTGSSYRSDMAVDDIVISDVVPCSSTISAFPYTESFEESFGDWEQASGDDFDWSRTSGTTPSSNTGPSFAADGSFYAFTESSFQNHPFKVAILKSPCFDLTNINNPMLNFQYHMYGAAMGKLELEISTNNGQSWASLWAKKNDKGNQWLPAEVDLSAYQGSIVQLRYVGTTGDNYTSDMAIDDISIAAAPCINTLSVFPYVESFETDFGIWEQDQTEDFDWSRNTGSTTSSNTGPTAAHDGVWYAYTESSVPNNPSKSAHLLSPCIQLSSGSAAVFNFWYHMYGATMGTLAVEVTQDSGATWNTLFVRTGEQSKDWIPASVNLTPYAGQTIQLRFVGKTSNGYQSDMAIDDMSINVLKGADKNADADLTGVLSNEPFVNIYPNPASEFTIVDARSLESEEISIAVLDMLGKQVYSMNSSDNENAGQYRIPTGTFAPGTYMVVIKGNAGELINRKLVVRE